MEQNTQNQIPTLLQKILTAAIILQSILVLGVLLAESILPGIVSTHITLAWFLSSLIASSLLLHSIEKKYTLKTSQHLTAPRFLFWMILAGTFLSILLSSIHTPFKLFPVLITLTFATTLLFLFVLKETSEK